MTKRVVLALVVFAMMLAARRAEAIYTRTSVPFAWKYSPTLEPNISAQDDAVSPLINLPFSFPFQDDVFTQIRIDTNGFVTLSNSGLPCGNCFSGQNLAPSGSTAAPDYTIAPWWADWDFSAEGDVYYGAVDDAFVVEWWYVRPYGGAAGQTYAFSLHLFADGRFRFLYMTTNRGVPSRDNGNTASIGYQGRGMARFGESMLFTTGTGGTLSDTTAYEFTRASDNLNLALFNIDPNVPDIVERWAPVVWGDIMQGEGRCDYMTDVNFDGDWNGANNPFNLGNGAYSMPSVIRYSLVTGASHYFIGYYIYHAADCTNFFENHPHDWEGATIAVNRTTGALDAVLTNTHGKEIPYHSPFDTSMSNNPHYTDSTDAPTFSYFSMRGSPGAFDTVGIGFEAGTHATWGRWHNRCVIGTEGSPSGCDDSHGGDGVVYTYGGVADTVTTISAHPNWFSSSRVRYALRPLSELYNNALQTNFCGESEPTALYGCQASRPWDQMNGPLLQQGSGDPVDHNAADLPWVWGENGVVGNACDGFNIILQPGWMFSKYFRWPYGRLNACQVSFNEFNFASIPVCGVEPNCPGEIGPISDEGSKNVVICGPDNMGVVAARCAGGYCDDMYLTCAATPAGTGVNAAGYFTPYFSEENPAMFCSPSGTSSGINGIIDGLGASGSNSDNVRLHCATIVSGHLANCQWSGSFSEEQGSKDFGGKFAVGVQCTGSFCDNLNYYVCNLVP